MYNSISKMGVYMRVCVYACGIWCIQVCVCMSVHVLYGVYRCVCYVCVCMYKCIMCYMQGIVCMCYNIVYPGLLVVA